MEKKRAALDAMMREELYRVAVAILTDEGMAALTMDRIAREIGVSRGTLYNYFADRDAVLVFVESTAAEPTIAQLDTISRHPLPPEERLETIARVLLEAIHANRALATIVLVREEPGSSRQGNRARIRDRVLTAIRTVLDEGIEAGRFKPLRSDVVAEILLGALTESIEALTLAREPRSPDELVPVLMEIVLNGLSRTAPASGSEPSS
jgi:AcrR family transcriptional regulator